MSWCLEAGDAKEPELPESDITLPAGPAPAPAEAIKAQVSAGKADPGTHP